MALEGIQGIYTMCLAYEYRTRAQPEGEGGTHKYRGYFPVYLIKPWVNQFVA